MGRLSRLNAWLAVKITDAVGTMWCAYLFAAMALVSLPAAIQAGVAPTVSWIAQTFLQLVLLAIILVGQKVESATSDDRAARTYQDTEQILRELAELRKDLASH